VARILLVEDEEEIRSMLAEVLADAGHEVVEAESGDAAALILDQFDNLDALVTEVHMPGRLNGLGLGRRFRERHALSPILYVTVVQMRSEIFPCGRLGTSPCSSRADC